MSSLFCSEFVMLDDTSLGHDKQTLLEFVRISVIVGDSPPRIREHPPTNSNPGLHCGRWYLASMLPLRGRALPPGEGAGEKPVGPWTEDSECFRATARGMRRGEERGLGWQD